MTVKLAQAHPAGRWQGLPAWYGVYMLDGDFLKVVNRLGFPIMYASPEAAIAAAEYVRGRALEHHSAYLQTVVDGV